MKPLNIFARFRKDVREFHDQYPSEFDGELWELIDLALSRAVVFSMPPSGEAFPGAIKQIDGELFRMPYPCVAMEFEPKYDKGENIGMCVMSLSVLDEKENRITNISIAGTVEKNKPSGIMPYICRMEFGNDELMKRECRYSLMKFKGDEKPDENYWNIAEQAVGVVMSFVGAMSVGNIGEKVIQKNKRRYTAGGKERLPLLETRCLTIEAKGRSNKSNHIGLGCDRNSPRQHLRRGHIRKILSGKVWVRNCIVGDASIGTIDKTYNIV